ncbi:MAG TPA: hypothetical protein VEA16_01365 [Vicinamibacterales bacterium]|nr:hypothetical protein [Vicinamibacterales bacterium]
MLSRTHADGPSGRTIAAPSLDFVAYAVIVLLVAIAPAMNIDDAVFFNYLNNTEAPRPLYYYMGYVHLIPEVTAYALSPLAPVAQAVLYRVVPLATALILYRELARLFGLSGALMEARLLALGIVLVLRVFEPDMWANVSYAAWTALIAAMACVARKSAAHGPYSTAGGAGLFVAGAAFPVGAVIVPPLIVDAVIGPDAVRQRQSASIAVSIIVTHVVVAWGAPDAMWNADWIQVPFQFLDGFREDKLENSTVVFSIVVLCVALSMVFLRPVAQSTRRVVGSLTFVGLASLGVYVASARFALFGGGFPSRYAVTALGAALATLAWLLLVWRPAHRPLLAGMFFGAAASLAAVGMSMHLRGPLEWALIKYRFMQVASDARQDCHNDQHWVFQDDKSSPVLLCRRRSVRPGEEEVLRNYTPSWGDRDSDQSDPTRPFILNPKPLF